MRKSLLSYLTIFFSFFFFSTNAQNPAVCPYGNVNFNAAYSWKTHSNWFLGEGLVVNFDGGINFNAINGNPALSSYEGTTSPSDDEGNIVFLSNGLKAWDENGNEIHSSFTQGNENGTGSPQQNGSAVQGIITVRHPLNPDVYHVFCTDDVLSSNNLGLDHFTVDENGAVITGPNTILNGRTYEGVSATWHANGIDVWVMAQTFDGLYHAFLITCDGLDPNPRTSDMGIKFLNDANVPQVNWTRGSLNFSWDGTKLAQAHPATWPYGDQETSIYDFNPLTGALTIPRHFSSLLITQEFYDCEFSPDGSILYVTSKSGEVGYYDVSSLDVNTMRASYTTIGFLGNGDGSEARISLAPDGNMYVKNVNEVNLQRLTGNLNTGATGFSPVNLPISTLGVISLPTMFIPPRDWLKIEEPQVITTCAPYNMEVNWLCKGTDAENTPLYENSWWIISTPDGDLAQKTREVRAPIVDTLITSIDAITGDFIGRKIGKYKLINEICVIVDTIEVDVISCDCSIELKNIKPEICAGLDILLDSLVLKSEANAEWSIDSFPDNYTNTPIISINGGDTLFTTNISTSPGTYKLIYKANDDCKDSLYITIKYQPTASIEPFGPLCSDSVLINMVGTPSHAADTNGVWLINGNFKATSNVFDPINDNHIIVGNNLITYGVELNGCVDTANIQVEVKQRVIVHVDTLGPFCANEGTKIYTANVNTGALGNWFIDQGKTIGNNGSFNPQNAGVGNYQVRYQVNGQCGGADTSMVEVLRVKDATITVIDTVLCKEDAPYVLNAAVDGGFWYVNDTSDVNNIITDSLNNKAVFNPQNYAVGFYNIFYVKPNPCGDIDTLKIEVRDMKNASFTADKTVFCADDDVEQFTAQTAGGVWSGAGIDPVTGEFNPANGNASGLPYYIYHEITGKCGHKDSVLVTVHPIPNAAIIGYPAQNDSLIVCVLDPNPQFTVAVDSGNWNNVSVLQMGNNVTIDLNQLTNNGNNMVTNLLLEYTIGDFCTRKSSVWLTTTNQLDATINQPNPVCDDVDSVQITRPNNSAGTWTATCGNCINPVSGMFYPKIAGDGSHDLTFTIQGNCGDVDNKTIVVNRTPDPTITTNNGDTIKQCTLDPIIFLESTENGGVWSAIGNDNGGLDLGGPAFIPITAGGGTFALRYSFAGACPASDTLIIYLEEPENIVFDFDQLFCDDEPLEELKVTPTGGTWTGTGVVQQNGTWFFDPNTANKGTNSNPGQSVIRYDYTVGLCNVSRLATMEVIQRPDATIDPIGPFCNIDSLVNLTAVDAGGVWTSSNGGIIDATNGVFNPLNLSAGTLQITYSISGHCAAQDEIDVDIFSPRNPTIIPQNSICLGSAQQITFQANDLGVWYGDVNQNGVLTPVDSGWYQIINVIEDVCVVSDTFNFYVNHVPEVDFTALIFADCIGFAESFTDLTNTTGSGGVLSSVWDFGNGQTSNAINNASSPYNTAGTFTVSLSNVYQNGCTSSHTKTDYITAYTFPKANFIWEPNIPSVLDGMVRFTNTSSTNSMSYLWDFAKNSAPSTTVFSPIVNFYSENGDTIDVTLTVSTIHGCMDSIIKPIIIRDFPSIFIPNAFTPDGDGRNDQFYPKGRNISANDYHFMIFNRWGDLIWETNDPNQGWDGTVKGGLSGNSQQMDVYVWKLLYKDEIERERKEMVGTVTLYYP